MRFNIRRGVFETNSSSCHSIVIGKDDQGLAPYNERDTFGDRGRIVGSPKLFGAKLVYDDLEFGAFDFQVLTSWIDKLGYAIAHYQYASKDSINDMLEEVTEMVNRHGYDIKGVEIEGMKLGNANNTNKANDQHDDDEFDDEDDEEDKEDEEEYFDASDYMSVDHQSYDMLTDFLGSLDCPDLEEFVFNPKYVLVIASDSNSYDDIVKETRYRHFVPTVLFIGWGGRYDCDENGNVMGGDWG